MKKRLLAVVLSVAMVASMLAGYICDSEGVDLAAIDAGTAHWTDANVVNAANKAR